MFKFVPRFQDRRMHLLHRIPQLDAKPTQNIPLPRVILCIDPRLHLLVIDDAHAETTLCLRGVKRRARFFDLSEELLPVGERVAKSVEDVFGFEVPKGLELEPFGNVVFQLLDLEFNEPEWPFKGVVGKVCQLCKCAGQRERQGQTSIVDPREKCTSFQS